MSTKELHKSHADIDGVEGHVRTEKMGTIDDAQVDGVDNAQKNRPREFSFLNKNPDTFETVDTPVGTFSVPAQVGSTYWAILKVLYENVNQKIHAEQLCPKVADCMEDRDPDNWMKYTSKSTVKAYHKAEKKHSVKPASSWQDRIVGNAKTLTRTGGNFPYGKRLAERGHRLKYGHENGKLYFILMTKEHAEASEKSE